MGDRKLFIGIDSGTQGTKAVLLDLATGDVLSEAYAPHSLLEDHKGKREQHPQWWIAACEKVIAEILAPATILALNVYGIGVSGQQHGFGSLGGATRQSLRPWPQRHLWTSSSSR